MPVVRLIYAFCSNYSCQSNDGLPYEINPKVIAISCEPTSSSQRVTKTAALRHKMTLLEKSHATAKYAYGKRINCHFFVVVVSGKILNSNVRPSAMHA